MVHLGRNPITTKGWEEFKNLFIDEDAATGAGQGKSRIMRKSNYVRLIFVLSFCPLYNKDFKSQFTF